MSIALSSLQKYSAGSIPLLSSCSESSYFIGVPEAEAWYDSRSTSFWKQSCREMYPNSIFSNCLAAQGATRDGIYIYMRKLNWLGDTCPSRGLLWRVCHLLRWVISTVWGFSMETQGRGFSSLRPVVPSMAKSSVNLIWRKAKEWPNIRCICIVKMAGFCL